MTAGTRVVLEGDLDLAARDEVLALLDEGTEKARASGTDLMVDLTAVTFIDSSGLSCLAQAVVTLTPDHLQVRLCGVDANTLRLLAIVGMDDLVEPG